MYYIAQYLYQVQDVHILTKMQNVHTFLYLAKKCKKLKPELKGKMFIPRQSGNFSYLDKKMQKVKTWPKNAKC